MWDSSDEGFGLKQTFLRGEKCRQCFFFVVVVDVVVLF